MHLSEGPESPVLSLSPANMLTHHRRPHPPTDLPSKPCAAPFAHLPAPRDTVPPPRPLAPLSATARIPPPSAPPHPAHPPLRTRDASLQSSPVRVKRRSPELTERRPEENGHTVTNLPSLTPHMPSENEPVGPRHFAETGHTSSDLMQCRHHSSTVSVSSHTDENLPPQSENSDNEQPSHSTAESSAESSAVSHHPSEISASAASDRTLRDCASSHPREPLSSENPVRNLTKTFSAADDSTSLTPNTSKSMPPRMDVCLECDQLSEKNTRLERRVARLRMQLQSSVEMTQTHGQRLLRAAYQEKIREMTVEHTQKITQMLNTQKRCFEEELEVIERETNTAMQALEKQLAQEREEKDHIVFQYENDRHEALEKTESTMQAVQRKLAMMHAKTARLEREKSELAAAFNEKLIADALAATSASRELEKQRLDILGKGQEEERERKNSVIDSLQREVDDMQRRLDFETDYNRSMAIKVARVEKEQREERERNAAVLEECKAESKMEVDRMGRLFASMLEDMAMGKGEHAKVT